MSENFRHHRASHDVQIVLVPVPVAGSPQPLKWAKPGKYPQQTREPWRPQRFIPAKQRKAERIVEIMRELYRRAEDARRMLRPNAAGLKAWLGRAA
jgi:hypothetical protein